MLLAKASLDTEQPKTAMNCISMIRDLRQPPEAAATETPITEDDEQNTGVHAKNSRSPQTP